MKSIFQDFILLIIAAVLSKALRSTPYHSVVAIDQPLNTPSPATTTTSTAGLFRQNGTATATTDSTTTTKTKGFRGTHRYAHQEQRVLKKKRKSTKFKTKNKSSNKITKKLRKAIKLKQLRSHLTTLEDIAQQNDGTRDSRTVGYDLSKDYVYGQLLEANEKHDFFDIKLQEVIVYGSWSLASSHTPQFSLSPSSSNPNPIIYPFVDEEEGSISRGFTVAEFSGSNDLSNVFVQGVDLQLPPGPNANDSTSGCEIEDFQNFIPGNVALLQRGTCFFYEKALNALAAGAVAIIIFNEGQTGRTDTITPATLFRKLPGIDHVPVLATSFDIGNELARMNDNERFVDISVKSTYQTYPTTNIIAETKQGDPETTIVIGAHLDSVAEGPGINDDGSASVAILETAIQMASLNVKAIKNKLQFVWFAAEELGILGSQTFITEYLMNKQQQQQQLGSSSYSMTNIALMLNFDMIAALNGIRQFGYDDSYPIGSKAATNVMTQFCDEERYPYDVDGDFDVCITDACFFYVSGIPIAGLSTGFPYNIKTQELVDKYGGTVDEPYDACYHQACDTIENINDQYLEENTNIIAHTVMTLALEDDLSEFLLRSQGDEQEDEAAESSSALFDGRNLLSQHKQQEMMTLATATGLGNKFAMNQTNKNSLYV